MFLIGSFKYADILTDYCIFDLKNYQGLFIKADVLSVKKYGENN